MTLSLISAVNGEKKVQYWMGCVNKDLKIFSIYSIYACILHAAVENLKVNCSVFKVASKFSTKGNKRLRRK